MSDLVHTPPDRRHNWKLLKCDNVDISIAEVHEEYLPGNTFETIYSNLNSFNYTTNMSNKKYLERTYTTNTGTTITVTIDMLTPGLVITTIRGDIGYDFGLTKIQHIDSDTIKTIYGVAY